MSDLSPETRQKICDQISMRPTSKPYVYPLQAGSLVCDRVKLGDIYTTPKEVGEQYDENKLFKVLQAFQRKETKGRRTKGLYPIAVTPVLGNKRVMYRVENGYHRHKISVLCGLQEIPIVYDQSVYKGVVEELESQLSAPQPSEQKYVPPHRR